MTRLMRVALFVTCLVDQLWPSVGTATVQVLRRAGCTVEFDERQTCCGQPAFNTGYRKEAGKVARCFVRAFAESDCDAIVAPSGSCTAMVRQIPALLGEQDPLYESAKGLSTRTHELSSFLVNELGVEDLGAEFQGRVTWHDACHGLRELGLRDEARRLIRQVRGTQLVEVDSCQSCCGFGGTFSVVNPEISVAMLDQKLQAIEGTNVDVIVSGDVSCLTQIGGRLARRGSAMRTMHLAQLLATGGGP